MASTPETAVPRAAGGSNDLAGFACEHNCGVDSMELKAEGTVGMSK